MRVTYRYFRRSWDESRDDEFAAWGPATYYFETDDALVPSRQIEAYDGGQRLCYDDHIPRTNTDFSPAGASFQKVKMRARSRLRRLSSKQSGAKGLSTRQPARANLVILKLTPCRWTS